MKIVVLGSLKQEADEGWMFPLPTDVGTRSVTVYLPCKNYNPDSEEHQQMISDFEGSDDGLWISRKKAVKVSGTNVSHEEVVLRIKHAILQEEKLLKRIEREVAAFENMESLPSAKRERISESVRLFVWQRDEGKCVRCGSQERLEFDHIIPVSAGGSSTERNIQLLCEKCNREKATTFEPVCYEMWKGLTLRFRPIAEGAPAELSVRQIR